MIPKLLLSERRWICHKDKVPRHPLTGAIGNKGENLQSNPKMWATHDEALKTATEHKLTGTGFCLGGGFVGIDLDRCLKDGQLSDFANGIVKRFNSFTEKSISGTGIHIYIRATLTKAVKHQGIEIYSEGRYFAFTGKGKREVEARQAELDTLIASLTTPQLVTLSRKEWRERFLEAADGESNNIAFSWGRALVARGWSLAEAQREILGANAQYERPLDGKELEATIRSAFSKGGIVPYDFIEPEKVDKIEPDWLWEPYFCRRIMFSLDGESSAAKSSITLVFARCLAEGRFPDGQPFAPCKTLIFTTENRVALQYKDNMERQGVPQYMVRVVEDSNIVFNEEGLARLQSTIEKVGGVGLVVLDPLAAFFSGSDMNKAHEARRFMSQLDDIVYNMNVCCMAIRHPSKTEQKVAANFASGSKEFANFLRSIIGVKRESRQTGVGDFVHIKPFRKFGTSRKYRLDVITGIFTWEGRSDATEKMFTEDKTTPKEAAENAVYEICTRERVAGETVVDSEALHSEMKIRSFSYSVTKSAIFSVLGKVQRISVGNKGHGRWGYLIKEGEI